MKRKELIELIQWVWAESRITPVPALNDEDAECMLDEYLAEHKSTVFTESEQSGISGESISKDELRTWWTTMRERAAERLSLDNARFVISLHEIMQKDFDL